MDWATAKNQPDFSEQDVRLAELTLWDTRDTRYADITMNIVEDIGMFETAMVSGVFKVPALAALLEDMGLYHTWERTLHAITRDTPAEDAPVEAEWRVQPEEAPVGIMANHHGERSEMQDGVTWLKTEQRRAYDIVTKHLGAHLSDNWPL